MKFLKPTKSKIVFAIILLVLACGLLLPFVGGGCITEEDLTACYFFSFKLGNFDSFTSASIQGIGSLLALIGLFLLAIWIPEKPKKRNTTKSLIVKENKKKKEK